MFKSRANGLDALLQSRVAADDYSPIRRRYSESPSVPFFLLSSAYQLFRQQSTELRPLGSANHVRLVCISDTHNHLLPPSAVPTGDILIHAGDLTQSGTLSEMRLALNWMRSLPHPHKIFIAGNHDAVLADPAARESLDFTGLTYLCNETTELNIRGRILRIFGSPCTPQHGNFVFQYPREQGPELWQTIPGATDVLVTHGPPKSHVDGFGLALWRVRPRIMVCGHIHAGRGIEMLPWDEAQRAWEEVVRKGDVGWYSMCVLLCGLVGAWFKGVDGTSLILNCAVMGGVRDQLVRDAIAVDI
ncbi:Metallo-dependent phosphatase-like protein [Mycena crocata]|nr:Metallo-dependent phosphatase-like protein [Mycena crocata]